jgi:hypothetical protein
MNHPSGHAADDPQGDAAVARVNALRAARGLPPIVERNPDDDRAELIADRDLMMIAVAVLHRPGCGATVPDALDATLGDKPDAAAFDLPPGVARVILDRVDHRHRAAVIDVLDAELTGFTERVATASENVRGLAHLTVDRLACAIRPAIATSIASDVAAGFIGTAREADDDHLAQAADFAAGIAYTDLIDRLRADLETMSGLHVDPEIVDPGHDTRCRRASVLNALAQLRGDDDMQSEAVRLALIVCHARPDLRPSEVFRAGAPVLLLPADATPAEVDAALCAELQSIATADGDAAP